MDKSSDNGNNFQKLASEIACSLTEEALAAAMNHLPNNMIKDEYKEKLTEFLKDGIHVALTGEDYELYLKDGVYDIAERMANRYTEAALKSIADSVPEGILRTAVKKDLSSLAKDGISGICNGESFEAVQAMLISRAFVLAREHATEQAQFMVGKAIESIADRCKDKGRGKAHTKKNLQIQALSDNLRDSIYTNIEQSVDEIWQGRNLDSVCKDMLKRTGKQVIQRFVEENSQKYIQQAGNALYSQFRFSGKGSRFKNHEFRYAKSTFEEEAIRQVGQNTLDVLDGKKNIREAAKDVVIRTVKNGSISYAKERGAELAASAVRELAKRAEKEIENKAIREVATKGLGKLANANAIMQTAGVVYDVGKALKQLIDGEITKSDFLRIVGEKGTAFVVSGVYSAIGAAAGAAIGGPVGAMIGGAIGSAIGYISTSLLYGSVLQAFDEAELSRQRYEAIHEFCEYSIAQMEHERQEFIKVTSELFADRKRVIETNLTRYENALKRDDVNELADSLNEIAKEFGGELQFKNMDEFDKFMMDESTVFEL